MDLDLAQLRALAAVVADGTFEAAARRLHLTPSAISQRIRALENACGQVLVVRSKPARPTPAGEAVLRLARQVELSVAETAREIDGAGRLVLPVAVNADSLSTWFLPAVAPLADRFAFDLHREDQANTDRLLRDGSVLAAVTTESDPVPGCSVLPLGRMRYRAVCTTTFAGRWFPDGVSAAALGQAPVVVYNRDDDLQEAWLRRRSRAKQPVHPPRHYVPSTADFARAVELGFGWGMLPDGQIADVTARVPLHELDPGRAIHVDLFWQRWKLRSSALDQLTDAVVEGFR